MELHLFTQMSRNLLLDKYKEELQVARTGHIYSKVKDVKKPDMPSDTYQIILDELSFHLPSHYTPASHIEKGDRILIDFEPSQPQLGFLVASWKSDSFQGEFRIAEGNIAT
jgi:hypothetical protein